MKEKEDGAVRITEEKSSLHFAEREREAGETFVAEAGGGGGGIWDCAGRVHRGAKYY